MLLSCFYTGFGLQEEEEVNKCQGWPTGHSPGFLPGSSEDRPPHLPLRKTRWVNRQGPWIPGRQLEGSPRKEKAKTNDLQGNLEALKSVPSLY